VSLGCPGVAQLALRCDVSGVVTILDLVVLNSCRGMADPFERFAGPSHSVSRFACELAGIQRPRRLLRPARDGDPSMYEVLFAGQGLEAAVRALDLEPVLEHLHPGGHAHTA